MRKTLPLLYLGLVVGCGPKATPRSAGGGNTPDATPSAESGKETPEARTTTGIGLDALPADLRHTAFEYYGLGNAKPLPLEIVYSTGDVVTGSQTTRLKEVKDGRAVFEIERTGGLRDVFGTTEHALAKDGIYLLSTTTGKIEGPQLEAPADLTPGKTWKSTSNMERNDGTKMHIVNTLKVVGTRKIKTPLAEYPDALLITSTGTVTSKGQSTPATVAKLDVKGYYVRGRGGVRTEIKQTPKTGPAVTIVIQEAK